MLSKEEYQLLKEKDMDRAMKLAERIKENPDPLITYRDVIPTMDLKHMLENCVKKFGDRPAFWVKKEKDGPYSSITFKEAYDDVNGLGTSLVSGGLKGKKIAVIGDNCYEWAISYFAAVCGTGVVVPLDKELPANELKQLVIKAECACVIFSEKFENTFKDIKAGGESKLEVLIGMDRKESGDGVLAISELFNAGKHLVATGNKDFVEAQIMRDEMSIILFTSGTTGVSKGVMLSHGNIVEDIMLSTAVFKVVPEDVFFSVLPIHHTYECTCGFLLPLYKGASIAYCEGLRHIAKNLKEAKPTVFLGVPALFENLYRKIWQNVRQKGKEETLKKVIALNAKTKKIGIDLGNIFFKEIRAVFGGRMRMCVSGGAAINPEVLQGMRDFGIMSLQGYGLTETSPICALNPDTAPVNASAGRAIPETRARIDNPDPETGIGEICLSGGHVMLGYYNNPEATAEVLKDGWYYSGDLGKIDEKGYIFITGRKKNVIITKNGKNIYPEELEYYLSNVPFVLESMVWGKDTEDGTDTLIVASVRVNEEELAEKFGSVPGDDELDKMIWSEIDKINIEQPYYKRIKKLVLRKEEFEKNTSKKIKRYVDANKG